MNNEFIEQLNREGWSQKDIKEYITMIDKKFNAWKSLANNDKKLKKFIELIKKS